MTGLGRITFDWAILGGRACIRGRRTSASLILHLVVNGMSEGRILAECPYLEAEDVRHALRHTEWLAEKSLDAIAAEPPGACPPT